MRVLVAFLINVIFNFLIGLLVARFLGPEEYGRFALALATAMAVQAAFLDWLRLGATRFYSERMRGEDPSLRATLDVAFTLVTVGLAVGAALLFSTSIRFSLPNSLIALALGAAVANGLFDFNTALVRARFHDTLFIKLVIVKNVLALGLTGGGAFWFGSARMALIGGVISLAGSVIAVRASLSDPGAEAHLARGEIARTILRYALPIVTANVLYMGIPLANRSLIAVLYGFSETGQFSLAFDIGSKAVQAIGSMLDVLLFQLAVVVHERQGGDKGKQRVADNMAITIAVIVPACVGIWLVLPSLQALIVPQQYRGPFAQLLTLMMPGLFCFATIIYVISPIFQIAKRTGPLIAAALVGCVSDPLILLALPRTNDASRLAIAQSGAFACAMVALIVIAGISKPVWPRARDLAATVFATAAMAGALLPLRAQEPSAMVLAMQVVAGVLSYGGLVMLLDIAGLRRLVMGRLRPSVARFRPS